MEKTIAAISTPLAVGGISVIRISGKEAIAVGEKVFSPHSGVPLSKMKGYRAAYGKLMDGEKEVDEGIATVFLAPHSYTGEDVVELSCHGGLFVTKKVLRLVLDAGAVLAQAGEFTKRAFENGKMTLTQAEGVLDMIQAENENALKAAKSAMDGTLYRKIRSISDGIVSVIGSIAAYLDYPEEDMDPLALSQIREGFCAARDALSALILDFDKGKLLRDGIDTVIVGKPNVGKSTLMNLLSQRERSIVTDIPGTTRDVVEERISLGNLTLNLADTAGLRQTDNPVEQIGVELAKKRVETASLILAVFDGSEDLSKEDDALWKQLNGLPVIAVVNKTDLRDVLSQKLQEHFPLVVSISAKEGTGKEALTQAISSFLSLTSLTGNEAFLFNERQLSAAKQALGALDETIATIDNGFPLDAIALDGENALDALLALSGEKVSERVVEEIFSHFCVGK